MPEPPVQAPVATPLTTPTYPISGFFIAASSRDSANSQKLSDIKTFGGDTVITFGTALQPVSQKTLPRDCLIDGKSCATVVAGPLKINRYFTFLDGSHWGPSILRCPGDRSVVNNGLTFAVLLIPNEGQGCTSTNGSYDVVVAGGSAANASDQYSSLASAATKLKMKYFAGLPAPAKRADIRYLPDLSYTRTLAIFTERFLQYQSQENDLPGLAGFYHHTEIPLADSPTYDSVLALYASQNQLIHRILPDRQAVVSPYIEARLGKASSSPQEAGVAVRKIAQTSNGVVLNIAIQDGMGTGKGGAFSSSEANSPVDPSSAAAVGKGSWASKYVAPNRDYFAAAAAGVAGTSAVLWANVEGMTPASNTSSCGDGFRGLTTKARLDRQLKQVVNAQKIVSYMWDSFFNCAGKGTALKDQLEAGLKTPILTDVTFRPDTGQIQVAGFNLQGSSVKVRWTTAEGHPQLKVLKASGTNAGYGLQHGLNPGLEMISIGVGKTTIETGSTYSLTVTNGWGGTAPQFFSSLG
ncbi:hypothetical protein ACIPY2_14265 [Paenarthrobacter sp. NPDC089675]|uniref:hypothetical protein n=1 Tax=Paenarthrobacter sp. NPDC089675 TaxID=3364376 RepID=UPI0037FAAEB1